MDAKHHFGNPSVLFFSFQYIFFLFEEKPWYFNLDMKTGVVINEHGGILGAKYACQFGVCFNDRMFSLHDG